MRKLLIIVLLLSQAAYAATGEQGPAGPQGVTGAQGAPGPVGASGEVFNDNSGVIINGGDTDNNDLVFGSSSLNNTGGTDDDNRIYFDKSKASLVAGYASSTQHDTSNLGNNCVNFGLGSESPANNTVVMGYVNQTNAANSVTLGSLSHPSGANSINLGNNLDTSSNSSISIGRGAGIHVAGSKAKSLYMAALSNLPTLYVEPATGGSTIGKIAIAHTSPHSEVALDIDGAMRVGIVTSLPTCDANSLGTILFDDSSGVFRVCMNNGSHIWGMLTDDGP